MVTTVHNESRRYDGFIVLSSSSMTSTVTTGGGSIKGLLGGYTYLTGAPFLPPIYGMFLGDSDCYHNARHGNSTQVAVEVARLYEENDMPRGWMLPNDGYGCGYVNN